MGKIAVVGSLNMDIVVQVERMPKVGETILGHDMRYVPGGKGANQACAAARLGGDTVMLGTVGQDAFGDTLLENLDRAGVDVFPVQRVETPTGTAMITVNAQGNNSIVVAAGANGDCDIPYVDSCAGVLDSAGVVVMQLEIPYETVWHVVRSAKKAGKVVVLNPAPATKDFPEDLYPSIDYITPNETELELLTGMDVSSPEKIAEAAGRLLEKGASNVLVTCGSQGALLATKDGWELFGVTDVPVTDTTAAGDTFNAAFVVALTEWKSPSEAVKFANKASTLAIMRPGAQSSIPSRAEVDRFDETVRKLSQGKDR